MPQPITMTCRVAVTGHTYYSLTRNAVKEDHYRQTTTRLMDVVFTAMNAGARAALRQCHETTPTVVERVPRMVLITNLAPGTDQLAAQRALAAAYDVAAILPGERNAYAAVIPDPAVRAELMRLSTIAEQTALVELDGELPRGHTEHDESLRQNAYRLAGRVALQNADFLLAVNDRNPARPRTSGGTVRMMARAAKAGIPVIEINPVCGTVRIGRRQFQPSDPESLRKLKRSIRQLVRHNLVLTPTGTGAEAARAQKEQHKAFAYFDEAAPLDRPALLLGLASIWKWVDSWCQEPRSKDADYKADPELARVEEHLSRQQRVADEQSIHYTCLHRASVLLIYVFGVLTVLFAGCAGMAHHASPPEGHGGEHANGFGFSGEFCHGAELVCLLMALLLFALNYFGRWHGRATDYRLLAERLRHASVLSVLGRAPWQYAYEPLPAQYLHQSPRAEWVDCLFRGLVRQAVLPIGNRNLGANHRDYVQRCRTYFVDVYLGNQQEYHRRNRKKLHRQHLALEILAGFLLFAAFAVCIAHMFVDFPPFTVWATTIPAVVGACHGLSAQFHLKRVYERSKAMEHFLSLMRRNAPAATPTVSSHELAVWVEQASVRMLQEADEWRVVFRLLNVPTPG